MSFLTRDDYRTLIKDQSLRQVIQDNEAVLGEAEQMAQAEMESYLNQRFDVAVEFAKTDTDRNPLLVMYMLDLVLYHLFTRITPRMVPETRGMRYENAINWLKRASDGRLSPNLTRKEDEDGDNTTRSRHGGNPKVNHQW
jgi:phage gp36-like protein